MSEQPKPKRNRETPSWCLVMEDLRMRGEEEVINDCAIRDYQGIQKYGTPLQPHNGRDSIQDSYEESMDLVVYLKNAIQELPPVVPFDQEHRALNRVYHAALNIMCALKDFKVYRDARKGEPRSTQKPQEASVPVMLLPDPMETHKAHTGHPVASEGHSSVQVASHQPTVFIPDFLPDKIKEDMKAWEANMQASIKAEREKQSRLAQELGIRLQGDQYSDPEDFV